MSGPDLTGLPPALADRIRREAEENDHIYRVRHQGDLGFHLLHYGHAHMLRWAFAQLGPLPGARVLDVGAGDGYSSVLLAQAGAEVTAIDVSAVAVDRIRSLARSNGQTVRVVQMAGERLDLPDQSMDAILCVSAFHHMDLERAAAEFHRVLVPGGRLALIEPLRTNPLAYLYRHFLHWGRLATSEERPMAKRDFLALEPWFDLTHCRGMFLLSFPLMCFDRLLGQPAAAVRITGALFKVIRGLDDRIAAVPGLDRIAWKICVASTRRAGR